MQWLAFVLVAVAGLELSAASLAARVGVRAEARLHKASQFLLISSPGERKVCWTRLHVPGQPQEVKPGQDPASTLNIFPLIDSGLVNPRGIAVDSGRGRLYVADPDGKAIFSYKVLLNHKGEPDSDGRQLVVVSGVEPMWVSVDQKGNLYYSEKLNNQVMRVNVATIERLESEEMQAASLRTLSEAEEEALLKMHEEKAIMDAGGPTLPPTEGNVIDTLYSAAGGVPAVSAPSGIVVDGENMVLWGNEAAGTTHGSVVSGSIGAVRGADTVHVLADNTNNVFGLAASSNALFFTTNTQYVYGMKRHGGEVVTMTDSLQAPRGLAWDGDGTMYVADQAGSMVYSFPSGRLKPTHTSRVTQLHDAFGLAILSSTDPFLAEAATSAAMCAAVSMLALW